MNDERYALIIVHPDGTREPRFPLNTKENVHRSLEELEKDASLTQEERETAGYFLSQSAELFKVACGCGKFPAKKTNYVFRKKQALPTDYEKKAYSFHALPGKYPIDTPQLVKRASAYFREHYRDFEPYERRMYAFNVKRQADKLNVPVDEMIEKYASDSFSPMIDYNLQRRYELTGDPGFLKLASYVGALNVDEFAKLVSELDQKNKVVYNKNIPDPYIMTLGTEKKAGSSIGKQWEIDGATYNEIDMKKGLAHPDIITLYGLDLVSKLRDPEVFDTLPIEDKKVILQYGSSR